MLQLRDQKVIVNQINLPSFASIELLSYSNELDSPSIGFKGGAGTIADRQGTSIFFGVSLAMFINKKTVTK